MLRALLLAAFVANVLLLVSSTAAGCSGDPNAVEVSCGRSCRKSCSNYKNYDELFCLDFCRTGCDCKPGMVYDDIKKKCVIPSDCQTTCPGPNEIYSGCSNGGCFDPRECANIGGPKKCVDPIPGGCVGGCLCKKDFYRNYNNTCVPEAECKQPTCGLNEEYSTCTQATCRAQKCSQKGKPVPCPRVAEGYCIKGCVCKEGFLKAEDGTCIPEDQCEPKTGCNGDRNAVEVSCGRSCRKSCSNYKNYDKLICTDQCRTGCDCKPGFVYDDTTKKCVTPSDCSQKCKVNEVFSTCTQAECRAVSCKDRNKPVACPLIAEGSCTKGCVCQPNYYRAENGTCVSDSECDRTVCPNGGEYNTCPAAKCDAEYCPKDRNSPQSCVSTRNCGEPRCTCGFNQKMNRITDKCVNIADCPPFKCDGPNEEYNGCAPICPGQNCSDYINNSTCPKFGKIGIVVPCTQECRCKKNYYRDSKGICVPGEECKKKVCPDGEVYDTCPAAKCDAENCPKDRNSPQSCVSTRNCGKPRCTCGFNQKRNRKTGECVNIADCPPFKCDGPNEEYNGCPPSCPGQNCSDYINNSTCPKFRIGIVVPCKPQCRCKKSYYRNSEGICVTGEQCKKEATGGCDVGCDGDPNAVAITGCGSGCRKSCSNYKQFDKLICPAYCRTGCDCNPGYIYDDKLGKCVHPKDCTLSNSEPTTDSPVKEPSDDNTTNIENAQRFTVGVNDFTFRFLNEVINLKEGENVITSPFSVTVPMANLARRTKDKSDSNEQLLSALNLRKEEIPQVFRELLDGFKNVKGVELHLFANNYFNDKYPLNPDFIHESNKYFDANATSIDCNKAKESTAIINNDVARNTNNKIKDLVTPDMITSFTRLLLVNGIYFKGQWKSKFNPNVTKDSDFIVNKDKTVKVKTMFIKANFRYAESKDLGAQVLEMPYENSDYSCQVYLPTDKYENIQVLASKLTRENIDKVTSSMRMQNVNTYIPRFKIETSIDLKEVLLKLGITGIFDEKNSAIEGILDNDEPLVVSEARQKAFIEMREEGSEAGAANVLVGLRTTSVRVDPPEELFFKADHPFIFIIKRKSDSLFCGVYGKP